MPITATEIARREKEYWINFKNSEAHKRMLEAEEKFLQPILEAMLELAKKEI